MTSNTLTKSINFLALIATVSLVGGCPEPSAEDRERRMVERNEARISDNNQDSSDKLCATPGDKQVLFRENHAFAEKWFSCSKTVGVLPPTAEMNADCVKEEFSSMTDDCLECFNQMTACTASNCWKTCAWDSKGQACQDCAVDKCGDEMFRCSGITEAEIPDFERD